MAEKNGRKLWYEKEINERTVMQCCVYLDNKWILVSVEDWVQSQAVLKTKQYASRLKSGTGLVVNPISRHRYL